MKQPFAECRGQWEPWNKGEAHRAEGTATPQGDLGDPHSPAAREANARARSVNLAIDSKLRSCDLAQLRVRDVTHGEHIAARDRHAAEDPAPGAVRSHRANTRIPCSVDPLFRPASRGLSRLHASPHLSTRQYAWIVRVWVKEIGLNPAAYGTHTLRRTKASLIYRRTKNLRAARERRSIPRH